MAARFLALAAVAVLALFSAPAAAQSTMTEVGNLNDACLDELSTIYGFYSNAVYPKDDCDPECLQDCLVILQRAINATASKDCPLQSQITYCFGLFPLMWVNYVQTCGLLPFTSSDAEAAALASEAALQDGTTAYNASREVTYQPVINTTTESARRRLMSSLSSVGEAGESNGLGCFPPFTNSYDFQLYIEDPTTWFAENWRYYSNRNGIIVSCFFWVLLTLILFNTRSLKFWKKKETLAEKVAAARARAAERKAEKEAADAAAAQEGSEGDDYVKDSFQTGKVGGDSFQTDKVGGDSFEGGRLGDESFQTSKADAQAAFAEAAAQGSYVDDAIEPIKGATNASGSHSDDSGEPRTGKY